VIRERKWSPFYASSWLRPLINGRTVNGHTPILAQAQTAKMEVSPCYPKTYIEDRIWKATPKQASSNHFGNA
jgi:hypothetical protein